MAKKINATTVGEGTSVGTTEKKARISVKDKARKHIDRISKQGVVPMVFEEVLTAYAAIGILKYDEVLEMSDSYAATYISNPYMSAVTAEREDK